LKKNIALLYGFSFFDQFMIVIALWVPYLATKGGRSPGPCRMQHGDGELPEGALTTA
jgi:hypothetical protein